MTDEEEGKACLEKMNGLVTNYGGYNYLLDKLTEEDKELISLFLRGILYNMKIHNYTAQKNEEVIIADMVVAIAYLLYSKRLDTPPDVFFNSLSKLED